MVINKGFTVKLLSKNILLLTPLALSLSYCISCTHSPSGGEDSEVPISRVEGVMDNSGSDSTVLPAVVDIPDQFVNDLKLNVTPIISNSNDMSGLVHWTKNYGPDGVQVHPETGQVTWAINPSMPSESFHVGLKVSSKGDSVYVGLIVHVGVAPDKVITVGNNGDYQNLKAGMASLTSGGTLVLLDGTYTGEDNYIGRVNSGNLQHPPSGIPSAYTTILAKHPGKAVLMEEASVSLKGLPGFEPVSYVAIKGLFVIDGQIGVHGFPEDATTRHHHIKIIRNGAQGGSDKREPFNTSYSDNILFENNYAFGGGRYKFTSYLASNIVWRRNVARYDHGPVYDEPKGTYSVYSSMDAFLSNNIAVDGDKPDFLDQGEIAGAFATPTTAAPTRARFQRSIQLNSDMMFSNLSYKQGDSDAELSHMVSWDVRPHNTYVKSFASGWFDHITMGDIAPRDNQNGFFHGYGDNFRGITNSILHNFQNGDMFNDVSKAGDHETLDGRIVDRFGADTLNISNFEGSLNAYNSDVENITDINPILSESNPAGGLRYITRVERDTSLSTMDQNGEGLGATVMTFLGKSGTFFGEPGYDEETYIPMWPFPMENVIKEKMAAYRYTGNTYTGSEFNRVVSGTGTIDGARGFAVEGQSLTNYIWGYLGNVVPPFNVTASVNNNSIVLQWQEGPAVSQNDITGYKVYDYNLTTGDRILLAELPADKQFIKIKDLNSNARYSLAVTALEGEKESGISYPVIVSTQ